MYRLLLSLSFLLAIQIIHAQPINDNCENAIVIDLTSPDVQCLWGTTKNANPIVNANSCLPSNKETVWYRINNFQWPGFILHIESDSLENPSIQIFTSCLDSSNAECYQGCDNKLFFQQEVGHSFQEFYVAVSHLDSLGASFDLCIEPLEALGECNLSNELFVVNTSMGSPPQGPFLPGERVSFEYHINQWKSTTLFPGLWVGQWLQSIIPVFGNGWDPSSFNTGPPNIAHQGYWNYEEIINWRSNSPYYVSQDYNGDGQIEICHRSEKDCFGPALLQNESFGMGWIAKSSLGQLGLRCGDGIGQNIISGAWVLQFSLTTRTYPDCLNQNNCTVKIYTLPDGVSGGGSPQPGACGLDLPSINPFEIICKAPSFNIEEKICNEDSIYFDLNVDNLIPLSYSVSSNSNVLGASSGNGMFIHQSLENLTNEIQEVTYTIDYGPDFIPGILQVAIAPTMTSNMLPLAACLGDSIILSPNLQNSIGVDLEFLWDNGYQERLRPFLVESDTTASVRITNTAYGCEASSSVEISIDPQPDASFDMVLNGDTLTIVPKEPDQFLSRGTYGATGVFEVLDTWRILFLEEGYVRLRLIAKTACGLDTLEKDFTYSLTNIDQNELDTKLKIYPNPSQGQVFLEATDIPESNILLELFSLEGKRMARSELKNISNGIYPLPFNPQAGIYFLKIKSGQKETIRKLIVKE